jgi:hypothetical protein
MRKRLCLIHANCQAEPLITLLSGHPEFFRDYEIRYFANYLNQVPSDEELSRASLLLYQWLEESRWGEGASERLLARKGARCRAVCLPNFLFKGYWPFFSTQSSMDYGDLLLDQLIAKGLDRREIVHLYLHVDLGRYHDLGEMFAATMAREREKEEKWDIKAVGLVQRLYAKELLFSTVNHPGRKLCFTVASELLALLDYPRLGPEQLEAFGEPFPEFVQPIHPQVAEYHGLRFVDSRSAYPVYGAAMDIVEYVNHYVACAQSGEGDFIGYLRLVAEKRKAAH